jgi:hypothetical protein
MKLRLLALSLLALSGCAKSHTFVVDVPDASHAVGVYFPNQLEGGGGGGTTLPDAGTGGMWWQEDSGAVGAIAAGNSGQILETLGAAGPKWIDASAAGTTLPDAGTGGNWYQASGGAVTPLAIGVTGQSLVVSGGLPAWGSALGGGLGPSGIVTAPPSIYLDAGASDAGAVAAWEWFNQQGSSVTNQTSNNFLLLSTTYQSSGPAYGGLVHPVSGSSTASAAASWVFQSQGTGNGSNAYLGFGVSMFCNVNSTWVVYVIVEQSNNAGSNDGTIRYLNIAYGTGTGSPTTTNRYVAMSAGAYTVIRIRQTGTVSTSPVDFDVSADGINFLTPFSLTNSTLFGGSNIATHIGFGWLLPSNNGQSGTTTATYYNYVEN